MFPAPVFCPHNHCFAFLGNFRFHLKWLSSGWWWRASKSSSKFSNVIFHSVCLFPPEKTLDCPRCPMKKRISLLWVLFWWWLDGKGGGVTPGAFDFHQEAFLNFPNTMGSGDCWDIEVWFPSKSILPFCTLFPGKHKHLISQIVGSLAALLLSMVSLYFQSSVCKCFPVSVFCSARRILEMSHFPRFTSLLFFLRLCPLKLWICLFVGNSLGMAGGCCVFISGHVFQIDLLKLPCISIGSSRPITAGNLFYFCWHLYVTRSIGNTVQAMTLLHSLKHYLPLKKKTDKVKTAVFEDRLCELNSGVCPSMAMWF